MKILFLCSSIEPGRDGVGDYIRRLAEACAAQGHQCLALALNDRHARSGTTELPAEDFAIVRWPAQMPWPARHAAIRRQIAEFAPDRISWQMVSYGFQPKGILAPEIIALARELRCPGTHVMLHEIWIGLARGDSLWARFIGWRQRRALLEFLRAADPVHLQTSNESYVAALGRHGFHASVLHLFSNIPFVPASTAEREAALLRHFPAAVDRQAWLVGVTFGTLHPQWQPEHAAELMKKTADRHGRKPMLLAIGRTGSHGASTLDRVARAGITTATTGELDPAAVSCLLQAADLGIAPHPCALIRKSGVVAAMLDHGLPILIPRDDFRLRDGPTPEMTPDPRLARLADLTAHNTDAWLRHRHSPGDSFPGTVSQFLHRLSA